MKRLISMLLALTILLSFAGCNKAPEATPKAAPEAKTEQEKAPETAPEAEVKEEKAPETAEPASLYPMTLTDQAGREVVIEEEPQKLVSGYYISTSLMIALELDDKLVGIEAKANKRPIYSLAAPELLELPNVGSAKEFDLEGCAALEPDLVVLPRKLKDAAETLEGLGIDVLLVNPENQQQLTEMIELIAAATNTQERAKQLLDFTAKQQSKLKTLLEGAPTPSVYLAGNSDLLSTAGNAMYQSALIGLAGGVNVAAELEDSYWAQVDYEQLMSWNPDYIILASDASYSPQDVLADPNLADCTAVKEGRVYQMPNQAEAWDSPVPSSILGALWMANVLHGDLLSDEECAARIDEYYETFYDFAYNEN